MNVFQLDQIHGLRSLLSAEHLRGKGIARTGAAAAGALFADHDRKAFLDFLPKDFGVETVRQTDSHLKGPHKAVVFHPYPGLLMPFRAGRGSGLVVFAAATTAAAERAHIIV